MNKKQVTLREQDGNFIFSFTTDMDYKGKDDQCTSIFLAADPFMERKEFESLCAWHGIPLMVLSNVSSV